MELPSNFATYPIGGWDIQYRWYWEYESFRASDMERTRSRPSLQLERELT
ncbi:Ryanodine receptor 2 [Sesbania bispinosa]|nr:Ryanodine receptor 2 [Sesbania bispinosa]